MVSSAAIHDNFILAALPGPFLARLVPLLEPISLPVRMVLHRSHGRIDHVYFPLSGIASSVAGTEDNRIEVGITGREGMTGLSVVLGMETSPQECFIQVAGEGVRLAADELVRAFDTDADVRKPILLYVSEFMLQIAHTALANGRYTVEERLARWLLLCQDRLDSDVVPLTHEFLSIMLGVRRPGVTIAVQNLESNRLIRAKRGGITVLDRTGLEEVAGDAYGVSEAEYASAMGQA